MYVSAKIILEAVLGMGRRGDKGEWWGGGFQA
jgi:hypothetical protein